MEHQVVARLAGDGEGAAAGFRRRINRPHVGPHQPCPALRFVIGGDTLLAERADDISGGALNAADNRWFHWLGNFLLKRGNTFRVLPSKIFFLSSAASQAALARYRLVSS